MNHTARPFVLHEATYRQVLDLQPNLAILPWAATEAHNYHLPHGTDVVEAAALSEAAAQQANARGARCLVLPCLPFGINHTQIDQAATITMRASTQQAVLYDVAESLVSQGIDRLVVMNFHGGNDFRSMIRDVMLDLPIFIVQINGYQVDPAIYEHLATKGEHADEFETSLMLHLTPQWVAPLATAGRGGATASALPAVTATPGVWFVRDWAAFTSDTGVGDPSKATAEKGRRIFGMLAAALAKVLVELSAARNGDFPLVIRDEDGNVPKPAAKPSRGKTAGGGTGGEKKKVNSQQKK